LLESTGAQLGSFVLFLVFARLIEPRAIGLVQVAVTLLAFLTILVEHGFTTTIIRSRNVGQVALSTAFWLSVSGGLTIAAALALLAGCVSAAYRTPELTPVLRALAWCVPVTTLSVVQSALLFRSLAFRTQAIRRLIAIAVGGVVGVVLAFLGYGVWALVARFGCETAVDCIIAWAWMKWRPSFTISRREAREFFAFGGGVVGAYLISFLNRRVDDIVVGLVLGPVVLAYFSVATRGVLLVTEVALRAAQRTAMPVFSQLQDEPESLRAAYYHAIEYSVALASPIFVGLSAVAAELCLTVFGTRWAPVIPAMRIVGFSGVAIAISAFTGPMLVATGRSAWLFYFSIVEAMLSVASSLTAAHWGLSAVAASYVLRSYAIVPVALYLARRNLGIRTAHLARIVLRPASATLIMAGGVSALRLLCGGWSPAWRLLFLVPAGALTYMAAMAVIARPTVDRLVLMARTTRVPVDD
jgi:PST family polysaccharide transporter